MQNKDNALLSARYIYDPAVLHDPSGIFADESRRFQGIPGIECTKNGRYFAVFYTGGVTEGNGNFLLLFKSGDGRDFGKAFMAVVPPTDNTRCYDCTLWISPDGRLYLFWSQSYGWFDGRCGVWCAVCNDPDAETVRFSEPRRITNGVMLNKPTVRSDGAWLLCCAVWAICSSEYNWLPNEQYSNVYISQDNGDSFRLLGKADYPERWFDDHMVYERADGSLAMWIRGKTGYLGMSESFDGGVTWTLGVNTEHCTPNSRFYIGRLKSGRLLLVNHVGFTGKHTRSHLRAMLSDDDGVTWNRGIMLDERNAVSYPDVCESPDGFINIIYDYNRNTDREILLARITEADIDAGKLVSSGSELRILVNKATGILP